MDCGIYKRQCDNRTGFMGAKCITWAGGASKGCKQCYQQARSKENQCREQMYEDQRFDFQTLILTDNFKQIAAGLAGVLLLALFLWLWFKGK